MTDLAKLARGVIVTGLTELPERPEEREFAGYVLFARNGISPQVVRAFTDALRTHCGTPIVAIDQEGGRVARLSEGVEALPPMMALGAADDLELTERAGEQTAFDLRRAGCTLDFAPVLDLALDPRNTVIGTRAFGSDPSKVASLGRAFARGLERGGIAACYKHFPGHGATEVDSHEALPIIELDREPLIARDVAPFAAAAHDASAMMSAHVLVRAFDPKNPATLSRAIATGLLRERLGFQGVLVTDCLEMEALFCHPERSSLRERSRRVAVGALNAGADLLLFSHHIELALDAATAVAKAVEDGSLALERLEEAHERAQRLRASGQPPLPLEESAPHPNIGREIARRAVTLIRGVPEASPLVSFAVSFGGSAEALRHEAPVLRTCDLPLAPSAEDLATTLRALEESGRRPIVLARRAHLYSSQADAIATVVQRYPDALVVSVLEPFDLPLFGTARHLLAIYGDDAVSLHGLADVLLGASMPTGHLPVSL